MRLVDADYVTEKLNEINGTTELDKAFEVVENAPTVCDIIDAIRQEIVQERDKVYQNRHGYDTYYADGLDTALDIIDEYTKGDTDV